MKTLAYVRSVHGMQSPLIAIVLALIGCAEDAGRPSGEGDGPLVFTRADSSVVEFPSAAEAFVWCGPWESGVVSDPSLHVSFAEIGGQPGWTIRAVVRDIQIGDSLRFPNYFTWDRPDSVLIFLFDPPNELATDTDGSGGFIVFHRLPCPGGSYVDFSIDAVLGSEFGDLPQVAVRGRFTARVTGPPGRDVALLGYLDP